MKLGNALTGGLFDGQSLFQYQHQIHRTLLDIHTLTSLVSTSHSFSKCEVTYPLRGLKDSTLRRHIFLRGCEPQLAHWCFSVSNAQELCDACLVRCSMANDSSASARLHFWLHGTCNGRAQQRSYSCCCQNNGLHLVNLKRQC